MFGAVLKLCLLIILCIHGALLVVPRLHCVLTLFGRVQQTLKGRKQTLDPSYSQATRVGSKYGLGLVLSVQDCCYRRF